jgi:hypothetical protein
MATCPFSGGIWLDVILGFETKRSLVAQAEGLGDVGRTGFARGGKVLTECFSCNLVFTVQ